MNVYNAAGFPTSQRINYVPITETYTLMLFGAVLAALCANKMKHENILCGKSAVF
jgi:hypothetical protein